MFPFNRLPGLVACLFEGYPGRVLFLLQGLSLRLELLVQRDPRQLVVGGQRIPLLIVRCSQGLSSEPELLFHRVPGFLGLIVHCSYGLDVLGL